MTRGDTRLDIAMVERGLVENRSRAKAMILAGDVLVDGEAVSRAGAVVGAQSNISLKHKPQFVGRGGEKIDHALNRFDIDVAGKVVADLGACTGGFTDAVLQRGAVRVYAIDVGYGQLDFRLREDPRVVVMERTNARYLEALPDPIDVCMIDVSFISLNLMFPAVDRILAAAGVVVPLIKPQFEAGKGEVGKGGVVRDPAIHRSVLAKVVRQASEHGFRCEALTASPLTGPAGNHEFLGLFRRSEEPVDEDELTAMIDGALGEVRRQEEET
ncbi:MAG TPA: TlyA family RNA methyltransferase [Thermomicrobiales bacterium]|nr:TlyA family RNA methyltransferase [Thermomicrobiales bacterium]